MYYSYPKYLSYIDQGDVRHKHGEKKWFNLLLIMILYYILILIKTYSADCRLIQL